MNKRWALHRHDLFRGRHNRYLLRAFRKDPGAFYIEVVEELQYGCSKELLIEREQFWMDFYQSCNNGLGYNLCPVAGSCEGVKHGPEYGAAISARQKGKKWSEEKKAHYRATKKWPKGWKWTDDSKKKSSDSHKGLKWTERQREIMRRKMSENPPVMKSVVQMSMNGDFIAKFRMIADAERSLGVARSNIHAVCKGKRPHCLGYKWKYA